MNIKKINVRIFHDEIEQHYDQKIVVTADNSFSLQNEGAPLPTLTIAMDKDGNLLLNTSSVKHIAKKLKEVKA